MARKRKEARRLPAQKTRNVDLMQNKHGGMVEGSDRYHIAMSESTRTEDSSRAHGSEPTSEISHDMTEEDSTAASSYESESELSSVVELAADTDDVLDNEAFFAATSYDSRPEIVEGWFDFACGWMDRPNMCVGALGGGRQTSLLRESKVKATKAMQRVKMNETIKRAANEASISKAKKNNAEVEKIQRGVARAAAAAAESVRKLEIQPSGSTSTQQDDNNKEKKRTKKFEDNIATSEPQLNQAIEEKMKQVSARAAEILKNTIEARAVKPRREVSGFLLSVDRRCGLILKRNLFIFFSEILLLRKKLLTLIFVRK